MQAASHSPNTRSRFIPILLAGALLLPLYLPGAHADGMPDSAYVMQQASAVIDARGGAVEVTNAASPLYGTRIEIPPGAVVEATRITINLVSSGSGYPGDVLVTDIEPYNLRLAAPAKLTLRYSPQYLYDNYLGDAGGIRVLPADARDRMVPGEMLYPTGGDTDSNMLMVETPVLGAFVPLAFSNSSLSGNYQFVSFGFDRNTIQSKAPAKGIALPVPKGTRSLRGSFAANGAGGYSLSQTTNQDGTSTTQSASGTYSVSSTGAFQIPGNDLSGQVLAGGGTVVFASTDTDRPGLYMAVKKSGSFSNASLHGSFQFVGFSFDRSTTQSSMPAKGLALPLPKGARSILGTFTANGTGGFTLTQSVNQDGMISSKSISGSYAVTSSGAFSIAASKVTGQVLAGGNVVVFASTDTSKPGMFVAVKKSGSFSNASVKGSYQFASFGFDRSTTQSAAPASGQALPVPKGFRSILGTFTSNGAGSFTLSQSVNQDGAISSKPGSGTYAVSSSGAFSIAASKVSGQVLAGGTLVIFASTDTGKPGIFIGVKK